MPNARPTRYGNLNVQTEVVTRSKRSTFIVTDEPDGQNQAITREEGRALGRAAGRLHRRAGDGRDRRLHRRTTRSSARPPGSTSRPRTRTSPGCSSSSTSRRPTARSFEPELTVIYTPNLKAEGYPDDRLIAVDLEQGVTRVFNSDYFGESKKGGLRMWNKLVYDRGGIPLHAGCKVIPTDARQARRPDRRPLRHRQDDDDLHAPERLAAGAGRLRRLDAERPGSTRPRTAASPRPSGSTPRTSRRSTAPSRSRARTSRTSRSTATRSTSTTRATPKNGRATFPFDVIEAAADRRDRGGALPADPEPEREHHPGRREARRAAGGGLLHARRDHGHERRRRRRGGQVPARARHEPVLPDAARPAGQPLPRAARGAPARGLPDEHRPRRRPRATTSARGRCGSSTRRRS